MNAEPMQSRGAKRIPGGVPSAHEDRFVYAMMPPAEFQPEFDYSIEPLAEFPDFRESLGNP